MDEIPALPIPGNQGSSSFGIPVNVEVTIDNQSIYKIAAALIGVVIVFFVIRRFFG